ncbi:VOC family protein [Fodinicola acaciae]|uniref:VOC family protein n=1 Tax=Fodinicola acaciae TaxID=2681555 RepID=UPI0013CFB05C|nr:VOC family protein [Fodinicola acaciae]
MTRPRLRVTSVTINVSHPHELAAFYSRLLGWPVTADDPPRPGEPPEAGWAQLRPPEGETGPTISLEWDRHYRRPVWPSEPDRQLSMEHLDIQVDDLDAAVGWAVAAGAVLADFQPQKDVHVLFDPDGHPFCLFR